MAFVIIIRGPAGTGKSEVANHLKQNIPNLIHVDVDAFKHMIAQDSSKLRSTIAHNVSSFFLKELIANKFNIVVEEIFREEYYTEVTNLFKKSEYQILRVFLTASKETLLKRDATRTKNKGEKIIAQLEQEIKPMNEDIIIDSTQKSVEEIKNIILEKLVSNDVLKPQSCTSFYITSCRNIKNTKNNNECMVRYCF